jgi:hypothetical protein
MEFLPESPTELAFQRDPSDPLRDIQNRLRENRERFDFQATPEPRRSVLLPILGIGLAVAAIAGAITYVVRVTPTPAASPDSAPVPVVISESTVTLTSVPDGASVLIDGKQAGQTPISLSLPVGRHVAELRSGNLSRRTSLSVEAGKIVTQHVDFGGAVATGELHITSEPAGAQVAVDGTLRGVTPLQIPEIAPGPHRITVSSGRTSVNRNVEITAGATATVVVSVPAGVTAQSG